MTTAIIAILVVLLLLAAFRLWLTANRLDRLHLRTHAAWAALEGALARRIVATRALAATARLGPGEAEILRALADTADVAPRADRDAAETALSKALAGVPPAVQGELAAELSDAAERVLLARRFYNDAVRDTRGLRASWFTRFFRLAGRAALPDYFELPEEAGAGQVRPTGVRVLLVDRNGRVLLCRGSGPAAGEAGWMLPGGALRPGEDLVTAALRELLAATGTALLPRDLVGPIWRREILATPAGDGHSNAIEFFFVTRPDAIAPDPEHLAGVERRWNGAADLAACAEPVHPIDLAARLPEAVRFATTRVAPDIPEGIA